MRQPDSFISTRRRLLSRLRNWDDHDSWTVFVDTYRKFIYSQAVKAGLSQAEAQDVVQETLISVSKKTPYLLERTIQISVYPRRRF